MVADKISIEDTRRHVWTANTQRKDLLQGRHRKDNNQLFWRAFLYSFWGERLANLKKYRKADWTTNVIVASCWSGLELLELVHKQKAAGGGQKSIAPLFSDTRLLSHVRRARKKQFILDICHLYYLTMDPLPKSLTTMESVYLLVPQ